MQPHEIFKDLNAAIRALILSVDDPKMVARRRWLGGAAFCIVTWVITINFALAAVQGEFGIFARARISGENAILAQERDALAEELRMMELKTRRMQDDFLDLDLLDQQIRERLHYIRGDEIRLD